MSLPSEGNSSSDAMSYVLTLIVCRRASRGSNCAKTGKDGDAFPPCAALSVSLTREASLPQLRQRRPRVEQRPSSSSGGVASRRGTQRLRLRGGQLADDETVRRAGWEHPASQRRDRAECRAHRSGVEIVCQGARFPSISHSHAICAGSSVTPRASPSSATTPTSQCSFPKRRRSLLAQFRSSSSCAAR